MRKTKADENPSSLSLQVAITQKNTKITRLCVIHTRKNTKITQFPRFLGKFRTCMCKWLKPGILSSAHECRVRGYCIPTSLNVILLVLAHTLLYCWFSLVFCWCRFVIWWHYFSVSTKHSYTITGDDRICMSVPCSAGYRHSSSQYSANGQCSVCGLVETIRVAYLSHCSQLVVY